MCNGLKQSDGLGHKWTPFFQDGNDCCPFSTASRGASTSVADFDTWFLPLLSATKEQFSIALPVHFVIDIHPRVLEWAYPLLFLADRSKAVRGEAMKRNGTSTAPWDPPVLLVITSEVCSFTLMYYSWLSVMQSKNQTVVLVRSLSIRKSTRMAALEAPEKSKRGAVSEEDDGGICRWYTKCVCDNNLVVIANRWSSCKCGRQWICSS